MKRAVFVCTIATLVPACAAPGSAASPLLGTWKLDGPEPKPSFGQSFMFLSLTFGADGTLRFRYLPDTTWMGGMPSQVTIQKAIQPREASMPYYDRGSGKLELKDGSQFKTLHYEIRGGIALLLRQPSVMGMEMPATIFRRVR